MMMKRDGMPAPGAGPTWRRAATRFAALALLLASAACADGEPAGPQEPEQKQVASVTVAPTPVDLAVGETRQLTATPKAADGTALSRTVTWRSADTSVVTVSAGGLVTARKAGQAQIIATSEGKDGAAVVGVAVQSAEVVFDLSPAPGALWVSAADRHNCALTGKGEVFCWGYNNMKQLGSGGDAQFLTLPTALAGGRPFGLMNAGELHNCAVAPGAFPGGQAFCWGSGMMGDGTKSNRFDPTRVAGGHTFTALAAGRDHTCGLTTAGDVYCWGWGTYGSLGSGNTSDATTPVKVAGGISFEAIEAGEHHTCGIAQSGTAYCWGYNQYAQLGDGSQVDRLVPAPVAGGLTFSSLSAGAVHTCGITTGNNELYCWGFNEGGAVGDGTVVNRHTPVRVQVE